MYIFSGNVWPCQWDNHVTTVRISVAVADNSNPSNWHFPYALRRYMQRWVCWRCDVSSEIYQDLFPQVFSVFDPSDPLSATEIADLTQVNNVPKKVPGTHL